MKDSALTRTFGLRSECRPSYSNIQSHPQHLQSYNEQAQPFLFHSTNFNGNEHHHQHHQHQQQQQQQQQ